MAEYIILPFVDYGGMNLVKFLRRMFNITNRTVTIFTIQTNEHHGERTTRLMDWQKATAVVNFASTNIIASLHLNEGSM